MINYFQLMEPKNQFFINHKNYDQSVQFALQSIIFTIKISYIIIILLWANHDFIAQIIHLSNRFFSEQSSRKSISWNIDHFVQSIDQINFWRVIAYLKRSIIKFCLIRIISVVDSNILSLIDRVDFFQPPLK